MITPMKKVTIIALAQDAYSAIEALAKLGVVHIQPQKPSVSAKISDIRKDIEVISRAHAIVQATIDPKKPLESQTLGVEEALAKAYDIVSKAQARDEIVATIADRESAINAMLPWGDFDVQEISALVKQGFYLGLYELPKKEVDLLPSNIACSVIKEEAKKIYCLLVSRQPIQIKQTPFYPGDMRLSALQSLQQQDQAVLKQHDEDIKEAAVYLQALHQAQTHFQAQLDFEIAYEGMGEAGAVNYYVGFVPSKQVGLVMENAKANPWAVLVEDPRDDEVVPTLLDNPQAVSMINPVLDFMNITPGYREIDVSFWFLLFFTLFFSILIGDAGYGSVFLLLAAFFHLKLGKTITDPKPFLLIYTLSIGTIIWGFLTGTFFGTVLTASFIKAAFPWLTVNENVQKFVFTVGVCHLTIAHGIRTYNKLSVKDLSGLVDLGWIFILWTCYFAVLMFVVNMAFPSVAIYLGIIGAVLVAVFSKFDIMGLFLGSLGAFGDIVSYIRLFAVGLAGVAVADAFNNMGMSIGFHDPGSAIGASLVIAFGHILNMVLSMFAILVHGIRLKVMEFSGHLGLEWTGVKYQPLRKMS